ncbi:MAG: CHAT domain-containing protein [Acidobacteria bacterium]|nr:CHAT domain-containing protein [Acidobacteriota bacterium]
MLVKSLKDTGAAQSEFRIPRLPNTRREAEAILALTSADARRTDFDFSASRAAAMSDELGRYRIIHIASHGFLNSINPELSGLVLSMVDEKGAPQNGFLLASEIYNLKLPATDLVVLSACQTGLGKEVRGEGLIGLTRGFMYAGSPREVVSMWNVSDRATADLMGVFYHRMLKEGLSPAAALRAAQIELIQMKQWKAPYYWAAFTLQGEWK